MHLTGIECLPNALTRPLVVNPAAELCAGGFTPAAWLVGG